MVSIALKFTEAASNFNANHIPPLEAKEASAKTIRLLFKSKGCDEAPLANDFMNILVVFIYTVFT